MKTGSLSTSLWRGLEVRTKTTRFSEESDGKLPQEVKTDRKEKRREDGKNMGDIDLIH